MKEIMRIQKIHAEAVRGIQQENNRTEVDRGKFPVSDIDWGRTKDNIYLVRSDDWQQRIREILESHGIQKYRKDAVMLIDTLYTASPGFFASVDPAVRDSYFRDCLAFHDRHFGNVVNAVIHLDETTPHLHIVSVPLVENEDRTFSLCARRLLGGKEDFRRLHDLLHVETGVNYDLERGQRQDPQHKKLHLDTYRFKIESMEEKVSELAGDIWYLEGRRDKVASELDDKITLQKLAAWAGDLVDKIRTVISGIRDWLDNLLERIEARTILVKEDLARASCRMRGIVVADTGERYKYPATRDGEPLSWAGRSPLYVVDGERFVPAEYVRHDNNLEWWEPEMIQRENRDPVSGDFMERLEDLSEQIEALADKAGQVDLPEAEDEDPVDKEKG